MLEAKHILKLVEAHIQNAGFPDEPKGLYEPAKLKILTLIPKIEITSKK